VAVARLPERLGRRRSRARKQPRRRRAPVTATRLALAGGAALGRLGRERQACRCVWRGGQRRL